MSARFLCHVCYQSFDDLDVVRDGTRVLCRACASKAAAPPAPRQSPLERPVEYAVQTALVTIAMPEDDLEGFAGKGTLIASPVGLRLSVKGLFREPESAFVPWERIRGVENRLTDKGWFVADFRVGDELKLKVVVKSGDRRALDEALRRLPATALVEPGESGGAPDVVGRVVMILIGAAALGLGLVMTIKSMDMAKPGGFYVVYKGLIVSGVMMCAGGVWGLIACRMRVC